MIRLSPKQKACLDAIHAYVSEKQVLPSLNNIAVSLNCSKTNAFNLVKALIARGYVRHKPGKSRSIEILGPARTITISERLWPLLQRYAASEHTPIENAANRLISDQLENA